MPPPKLAWRPTALTTAGRQEIAVLVLRGKERGWIKEQIGVAPSGTRPRNKGVFRRTSRQFCAWCGTKLEAGDKCERCHKWQR